MKSRRCRRNDAGLKPETAGKVKGNGSADARFMVVSSNIATRAKVRFVPLFAKK
jgi:hypothetical protein